MVVRAVAKVDAQVHVVVSVEMVAEAVAMAQHVFFNDKY